MRYPTQTNLRILFDIELQYVEGKHQVLPEPGRVGEYLGSGEGTIRGEKLNGRVLWDLFEKVEEILCASNLRGLIETDDGATITFDTLGFFRRPTQPDDSIWINSSAVTFHTDNPRYIWLNELVGSWQGTFDMAAYQHHYRVYHSVET